MSEPNTPTTVGELSKAMTDSYAEIMGHVYHAKFAQEMKSLRELLKTQGDAKQVLDVWLAFLESEDGWLDGKRDITYFCGNYNRLFQIYSKERSKRVESVDLGRLKIEASRALKREAQRLNEVYAKIPATKRRS